jgi:hypothetical protein
MPPTYLSASGILALNDELTDIIGSTEHVITAANLPAVHDCYQRHLAGKIFQKSHNKAVKVRVLGPILQCIESEVAKGAIPLHQIKEAYLWFGEHYGLGLGEDGSEPAAVPVEDGDGLDFATGSDDLGEEEEYNLFSSSDESLVDDGSSGEEKEEVRSAEVKVPEPRGKSPVRSVHTKSPAASAPKSNSRDPRARAAAFKESQRVEAAKAAAHTARVNRASIKSSIRANELHFDNDEMESRMSAVESGINTMIKLIQSKETKAVPKSAAKSSKMVASKSVKAVKRAKSSDNSGAATGTLKAISAIFEDESDDYFEEEKLPARIEPVGRVVGGACPHPSVRRSYDARLRKRAQMQQHNFYDHHEEDGAGVKRMTKMDLLHACQARDFVQSDLIDASFDTVLKFVRAHKFKQERNRQECEFIASSLDYLVRDVCGGSYSYLFGTDTYELMIRRLQAVMTADGKGNQKKAWKTVKAYLAPVQGAPGVFMNPSVWAAADKEAGLYEDTGTGDSTV